MYDLNTTFFSAIARSAASASPSVRGAPIPRAPRRRMAAGTTASIRSAREANPRMRSICAGSAASGPMWRRAKAPWSSRSASVASRWMGVSGMAGPSGSGFGVGVGVEELIDVGGVGRLDAEDPGGVRVLVHALRRATEIGVGADDLAVDRRIDIRGRLHRLDHGHGFAGRNLAADLRRLDEHDVAELFLRMVGDAHGERAVGLAAQPFVRDGVAKLLRGLHALSLDSTRIFP